EPQPSLRSTGASWTVSVRLLLRVVGPVVLDDVLEPAGSGPGLGEGVVGVQQRTGLEREAAAADAAGELVFEALDRAASLLEPLLPASRGPLPVGVGRSALHRHVAEGVLHVRERYSQALRPGA